MIKLNLKVTFLNLSINNFFYKYFFIIVLIFFSKYIKMSKNLSPEYYQDNKKQYDREHHKNL